MSNQLKITDFVDLTPVEAIPRTTIRTGLSQKIVDTFLASGYAVCRISDKKHQKSIGSTVLTFARTHIDKNKDYAKIGVITRINHETDKIDAYIYRKDKYEVDSVVRLANKVE